MDKTAATLVAFAAGPENIERRAAAMMMLAELGISAPQARAVAAAAVASPTVLQEYALRWFERLRPEDGLSALVPLFDTSDPGIRERARRLVADFGGAAVPAIAAFGKTAPRTWLPGAVEVLGGIGTGPAVRALFELAARGDHELVRVAVESLHKRTRDLAEKARGQFLEHVLAAATRPAVAASPIATTAIIRTLANLGLAGARVWLLAQATRGDSAELRAEALRALAACLRHEKLQAKEFGKIAPMLSDADFPRVVRPALDLLESHQFGKGDQAFLLGLRESPHVAVRSFALAKLGASEAPKAVSALLSSLDDAEAVRRSAARSLGEIPEARQALMKRFVEAADASAAFTMAETLIRYDVPWRRPTLEQIWKRWQKAFEAEDRIQGAFLHFLRTTAPEFTAETLRKQAASLLRTGRARDAARLRTVVREIPGSDAEDGYQLALALLKTRKRGLDHPIRRPDAALDVLLEIEAAGFATGPRLRKERALDADELYATGFALAETNAAGVVIAQDVLAHLAKKFPRTKIGKAAKNKLELLSA
ncbi:MAG: HEAT repeat domain-containing protein [Deltaproteobacteria bacterium]|nr:HEAT repeat domain-containing protein [Deltaproteobacteria bacterium]